MLFIYAWHKDLQPTRIMIVNVDRPFNVYQNKDKQEMSRKVNFCWNQFSNCNEDIVRGNSGDGAVTGWDQRLCSSIKKSLRQDYLMYCAHERRTDYKCLSLIAIFMRYKLPVAVQGIYFKDPVLPIVHCTLRSLGSHFCDVKNSKAFVCGTNRTL